MKDSKRSSMEIIESSEDDVYGVVFEVYSERLRKIVVRKRTNTPWKTRLTKLVLRIRYQVPKKNISYFRCESEIAQKSECPWAIGGAS